eukprot:5096023-Pyramimonas_sp.AAC.1
MRADLAGQTKASARRPARAAKLQSARSLLQVRANADKCAINRQFRTLALPHHPDKEGGMGK